MSTSDNSRTAMRRGRDVALDRVAGAIERVTPVVGWLIPPLLVVFGLGLIASAIIGHAIWNYLSPFDLDDTLAFVLLMGALLAPAVLLFLFWLALIAIRELPDKLRQFPDTAVRHSATLGEITRETRARPTSPIGWLRNLGRMAKLLYNAKEDLLLYAPLLELLNPLLLIGTALSVPAIIAECLIAAIILIR